MKSKRRRLRPIHTACLEACERRVLMSVFTVNTVSDSATPPAGTLTLRQAVADANSNPGGDTIAFSPTVFAPGSLHTITLSQGQMSLSGNTTIQGPGAAVLSIDGDKNSRIFQISSGITVSMSGLTMTDGSVSPAPGVSSFGGAVLNAGTLNLTNVTVSNSIAAGGSFISTSGPDQQGMGGAAAGGGIYSTGPLTLVNSVVSGNTAQGGGSYTIDNPAPTNTAQGGGIYVTASLTLTSSMVTGNTAAGGEGADGATGAEADGGGIFVTSTLSLNSSVISSNSAKGGPGIPNFAGQDSGAAAHGGAIYVTASANVSGGSFTGNSADGGDSSGGGGSAGLGSGGAIFSTNSLSIMSSTLSGNTAKGGNGPFDDSGPGANGYGGAIEAQGPLSISSSTVSSNSAQGGSGSPRSDQTGASADGGGIDANQSLSITGSTISGNTALAGRGGTGGATYAGSGGSGSGGGILTGGTAVITRSTVSGNTATGAAGDPPYADSGPTAGAGGAGAGGGVYNVGTLTITDSTMTANQTQGGSGADNNGNPGGNGADASGSALYSTGNVTVDDSTISGNTTTGGVAGNRDQPFYPSGTPGQSLGAVDLRYIASGAAVFNNTIISGNTTAGSVEDDIDGTADSSSGSNLIGVGGGLVNGVNGNIVGVNNPQLSPLANHGGPTLTLLPIYSSPAVNAGNNSLIPAGTTSDQRGYARIAGSKVDIGADELQSASVSGTVFNDLNGDGVRETGEGGMAGVTVYADLSNASIYKSGDPTAVTNSSGNYTLTNVPEGAVIIRQKLPAGYRQSDPVGGAGEHVTVTPAGVNGALFGDSTRLYVSGVVTFNGTGQGGVTVYADLNNDGKFESNENNKVTNSDGSFSFVSLAPSAYTFRVVPPAGEMISGNAAITINLGSGGADQNLSFSLITQSKQLTGKVIGTSGSFDNQGNTAAKAFDGNLSTYFDAPTASGSYAGLDLGSAMIITSISYAPRSGWAGRMVGGMFQASNSADFSSGVVTLYTVPSTPATGTLTTVPITNWSAYRYVRYIGPANSYSNIAEAQFFGYAPPVGATLEPDGTLVVNGSQGADTIHVQINSEDSTHPDTVIATINGNPQTFNLTNVLQIVVNPGAGNDTVTLDGYDEGHQDVTGHGYESITINGGDGNDTVNTDVLLDGYSTTNNENLLVVAGGGTDSFMIGNNGYVTLIGGTGKDTFSSNGNPDGLSENIYGGSGHITIKGDMDTAYPVVDGGSGGVTLDFSNIGSNPRSPSIDLNSYVNVHDVILGGLGGTVIGTNGDDTITDANAGASSVSVQGGGGNDTIYINQGDQVTVNDAGPGASHITVYNSLDVTITGGDGNDVIDTRTSQSVTIDGGPGVNTAYVDSGAAASNIQNLYTSNKLAGTIIGTPGSYRNHGTTIANAFDGNLSSFFDGPDATGDWVGLDLGSAKVVNQVQYAPRVGWESRMVGGEIQASNSASFSSGVVTLFTITATPPAGELTAQPLANTTAYRYYRYIGPANSYCDIAELEFDGLS